MNGGSAGERLHCRIEDGEVRISVDGLLFDMDGVLVNSIESVRRCWRQWSDRYGVRGAETVEIPHGTRAVEVMRLLKPDIDVDEGLRLIEDLEVADVGDTRVLPGARDLLESLPQDRWTIVTSATRRLALSRLRAVGLPVPDRLITAESVTRGKPDPEPYRRGAEALGFANDRCLVVEDAVSGIGAGIAAGCRVLGVEGTYPIGQLCAAGAAWVVPNLEGVRAELHDRELSLVLRPQG